MPKFDVHRIESFRVKIADVQADTPEEALAATQGCDLHALSRDGMDIPLDRSVGSGAYVSALAYHEAAPSAAMVELAGSHGEQGEHHFDFDADAGKWSRRRLDAQDADVPASPQEKAGAASLLRPGNEAFALAAAGHMSSEELARLIPEEVVCGMLGVAVPGGSRAQDWLLPHEHPQGRANVNDLMRRMFVAAVQACHQAQSACHKAPGDVAGTDEGQGPEGVARYPVPRGG